MHTDFNRLLSDAPEGKGFYTGSGEIKNLKQLAAEIMQKGPGFYMSYSGSGFNHFSNWIEGVFEDSELADALRKSKTHDQALTVLENKIKFAELYLSHNSRREALNDYLTNGDFSIKNVMDAPEFSPEHHKFETILDIDGHSISKVSPPKTTFIQNAAKGDEKLVFATEKDILQNKVPTNSIAQPFNNEENERVAFAYFNKLAENTNSLELKDVLGKIYNSFVNALYSIRNYWE